MLPLVLTILTVAPAQVGDPPPPPPVFDEDCIGEDSWDPSDAPDVAPDTAPVDPELAPEPPSHDDERPRAKKKKKEDDGEGLDDFTTLIVQLAAVGIASVFLFPVNYYATILSCGLWPCVIWPAIAAFALTWTGDFLGPKRAAVLWPFIASAVTGSAIVALSAGGFILFFALSGATGGVGSLLFVPAVLLAGGGVLCGPALSAAAAGITYYLVAEPKLPGDKGQGFPGLLEPAAPSAERDVSHRESMAY